MAFLLNQSVAVLFWLMERGNGLDGIRWPCFEHALYSLNYSVSPNDNVKFLS